MGRRRSNRGGGLGIRLAPLLLPLLGAGGALAAQWIVDDDGTADFRSIQAAINAVYVHSGDTILVRPGRYTGNVYLDSKDLAVRSETGPFATVLDGQQSGSVVSLYNRSPATRIEGFTITGGQDQTGGGIWIYGGAPVVTRNVIEGNAAVGGYLGYGYGGGIEIYSSAALITRNVIRGNVALDGGGGIDVYYSGPSTAGTCCPLIANNTITGNSVSSPAGRGGGIMVAASEPRLTSSVVSGNVAAAGGGIYVEKLQGNSDLPDAANNLFFGNAPDEAASNDRWRLPSSNLLADPRLGEGNGIALWPRSVSPALEMAETAIPVWPDLVGQTEAVDSDLDGTVLPDAGAIENRGEITALGVAHDPNGPAAARLVWDGSINPAVRFNVYRGDFDPFRSDGGFCLAAGLTAIGFTDPAAPAPGSILFYLVTGRGVAEGSRGLRSDGTPRPAIPSCP